ncbi:hypothetical protein I2I05_09165 [Hymenobacter sp. BT683]|uniref:Uncharacterized protein n=1 Tax=Hymenobacter jeongseonensis TaxID=2791027 RepID=A0ABS0IGS6_9BACT|nr:hypothetical protein [Hymenobacter jeongseonensis]MBF9237562.1 hypothetical protein [Hymenobacter jeongseonensis]
MPAFSQGLDTVFAVHKLFREKRASGQGLQSIRDSSAVKALYAERVGRPRTAQEARQDALASTAFTIAGTLKASDYSTENEAAIIRRYNNGESIPPAIRRKLKRKHFHRTTSDVLNP